MRVCESDLITGMPISLHNLDLLWLALKLFDLLVDPTVSRASYSGGSDRAGAPSAQLNNRNLARVSVRFFLRPDQGMPLHRRNHPALFK
jgi:hypothetical protein